MRDSGYRRRWGCLHALGYAASQEIWQHLHGADYIDAQGRIQDSLREALKDDSFTPPERFAAQRTEIAEVLRTLAGRLDIKNADERKRVRPRQAVLQGAEFKELWDRIKHKTTYRVQFDNDRLIAQCTRALQDAPRYPGRGCSGARPTSPSARPAYRPPRGAVRRRWCWTNPTFPCRTC